MQLKAAICQGFVMAELEFPIIYRPLYPRACLVITMLCFPVWGALNIFYSSGTFFRLLITLGTGGMNLFAFQLLVNLLLCCAAFLLGLLLTLTFSDSRIIVSKSGLSFPRFMLPWLAWRRNRTWSDLTDVRFMLADSVDVSRQNLQIKFLSGGTIKMNLASMQKDDASRLLLALDVWGSQYLANPESLESIRKLTKKGDNHALPLFTEMWEEELNRRFGSLSYVPLEPGHRARNGSLQVLRQLNFGGHSAVYLAQLDDKDLVVLKESVIPDCADESARQKASEMFDREATLLIKLQHPFICKVFDHFVEDGRHYLLLEYIPGRDLRQIVHECGPQDSAAVLKWAMQIASVLSYMHESSPPIIHRDVTPDNIVLKENGEVTLVDFGAANELLGTATGTLVGKQAYIAPEQFRGKATMQSDIYALGGTLFFLLTGQDPEPLSTSHPKEINLLLTESVDAFVASCTELDVDQRILYAREVYSTAKHLVEGADVELSAAKT